MVVGVVVQEAAGARGMGVVVVVEAIGSVVEDGDRYQNVLYFFHHLLGWSLSLEIYA